MTEREYMTRLFKKYAYLKRPRDVAKKYITDDVGHQLRWPDTMDPRLIRNGWEQHNPYLAA